ncbi:MAG: lysylphosphatidylglycerol synthase transmembrane domain-containing protein, partial [Verrucomicrobia bacterium]|nr:lysylphosphatidylglycerol synthase transmembrane domain-containing protein [Verrucomicrobiota bacterium]
MADTSTNSSPTIGKYLRYGLQGVTLCIVATAVVLFFTVESETWNYIAQFNWWFAPIILSAIVVAWLCNGGRIWINSRALGHQLQYRQAISVSMSTEFGIAASPAGMGGTALRLYLLKKAHVPLTTSASMLAADVFVDLTFFGLLTPIAIFFIVRDKNWARIFTDLPGWQMMVAAGLVLGGIACMVLFFQTGLWAKIIHTIANATPHGRRQRWPGKFRHFRWALKRSLRRTWLITRFLFRKRRSALLINFSLASVQWLCRYGALPLILLAFGSLNNPFPLLFIQGFLFLFAMLVFLPGGG